MTEARHEILHPPSKFREWMRNILGLFFTALLIFVLFKVIMLSRDVEESRRMLKELSSGLAKAKRENDDLRKELRFTKAKVENIIRKFSNAQKVLRLRRSGAAKKNKTELIAAVNGGKGRICHTPIVGDEGFSSYGRKEAIILDKAHRCHRIHACLKTYTKENTFNCTRIRNCLPSERKRDFIHVYGIRSGEIIRTTYPTSGLWNVLWRGYFSNNGKVILKDRIRVLISRGGTFHVYCNLRVNTTYIQQVFIKTHHSKPEERKTLFSSVPNNAIYEVNLSGLAKIPDGTEIYIQVKLKTIPSNKIANSLFRDVENNNNFGVFLIS